MFDLTQWLENKYAVEMAKLHKLNMETWRELNDN